MSLRADIWGSVLKRRLFVIIYCTYHVAQVKASVLCLNQGNALYHLALKLVPAWDARFYFIDKSLNLVQAESTCNFALNLANWIFNMGRGPRIIVVPLNISLTIYLLVAKEPYTSFLNGELTNSHFFGESRHFSMKLTVKIYR